MAGAGGLALASGAAGAAPPTPRRHRGYYVLMQSPFTAGDALDEEDLAREVELCVRGGAHGLVWPQLMGEFYNLTDAERRRGAEVILKTARRRTPVVIGVQAPTREQALALARHAEQKGADALISMPPYPRVDADEGVRYFRELAAAVRLPVFIQNTGAQWGPALPAPAIIELARAEPRLAQIKEEAKPIHQRLAQYAKSKVVTGIFSGTGGTDLFRDLAHGAVGTMGAAGLSDVGSRVFELLWADKEAEARELHQRLYPLFHLMDAVGDLAFVKQLLVKRGVFKTAKVRRFAPKPWDPVDAREFDRWWERLAPHLVARV